VNEIEEGLVPFLDCSLMMVLCLETFNVGFQVKLFADLCRLGVVRT
jgi:hypothetical protein